MKSYKVITQNGITIIKAVDHQFTMQVLKADSTKLSGNTAVLEATLYIEQGGFLPECSYLFELLDDEMQPTDMKVDIDQFKAAVDYFFNTVMGTDLYVKSIPRASTLCPAVVKNYHF